MDRRTLSPEISDSKSQINLHIINKNSTANGIDPLNIPLIHARCNFLFTNSIEHATTVAHMLKNANGLIPPGKVMRRGQSTDAAKYA